MADTNDTAVLVGIQHVTGVTFDDGSVATIEHEHVKIHEGVHWYLKNVIDFVTTAGTVHNIVITAGATSPHLKFELYGSQEMTIEVYEGPTVTAATGSAITPINNRRGTLTTPTSSFLLDATITSAGTLIWKGKTGASRTVGAASAQAQEIVLAPSTKYSIVATKADSGTAWLGYNLWFYEENEA